MTKKIAMTDVERQAKRAEKQLALGRKRRGIYLTDSEFLLVKKYVEHLRKDEK